MRNRLLLSLMLVAFLVPCEARAWNDTGHMTVALIAYRRLSEDQRHEVATLLKQHPHYQSNLIQRKPDGVTEEEWAFMRAAVWPDYVRPSRGGGPNPELFKGPEITRFHRGVWHYIDMPWVPPA